MLLNLCDLQIVSSESRKLIFCESLSALTYCSIALRLLGAEQLHILTNLSILTCVVNIIVLPAKGDLWQLLSYVATWNGGGGAGSNDSCGWLRGERQACLNRVITPPAGFQVSVWQLSVVSIETDSKQWPWLGRFGFCHITQESCRMRLDTFIFCLTYSTFRFSLTHLSGNTFEWN